MSHYHWPVSLTALLLGCIFSGTVRAQETPSADKQGGSKPRTIVVKVVDSDDKPLSGANIHASLWTKETFAANRDFKTDDEGKTIVELPQTLDILRLWATKPGFVGLFANWDKDMPDGQLIPDSFTFRLEKGATIGGTVVTEDGKPIEGARVSVMIAFDPQRREDKRPIWNTWLAEGEDSRVTDADGKWSLDNAPPGDVEVALTLLHPEFVSDYSWTRLKQSEIKTSALRDQTARLVMQRGISVKGIVKAPGGEPVPNAVVIWGDRPYFTVGSQEVRTDAEGKFELPPLLEHSNIVESPLPVLVVAPGFAPQQQKVALQDGASLDFQLEAGKTVRLRFADVEGNPIPEVFVGVEGWRETQALYNERHPNVVDTEIPRRANKFGIYQWTWAPEDEVAYSFYKEGFSPIQRRKVAASEGVVPIILQRAPAGQ